jgi:hydroxymethylbilane synthase
LPFSNPQSAIRNLQLMATSSSIRLGTRASALARWQADWVAQRLIERGIAVELVLIRTQGDVRGEQISEIGGQGVFTKELQRALLEMQIDLAVHSLKDLPTDEVPGLMLAAVPPREACGDVLVCNRWKALDELPHGARVGTGSLRRQAQLLHARADLTVESIRGNVDTRLKKLDEGQFDAIVLAEAGLRRLGLATRIAQVLPISLMLPAVGQGALGLECRADDDATQRALATLDDAHTHAAVIAERTLLATLRGGCLAPVGAWARVEDGDLKLDAVVLDPRGTKRLHASGANSISLAHELGCTVGQKLLDGGAGELISASRRA